MKKTLASMVLLAFFPAAVWAEGSSAADSAADSAAEMKSALTALEQSATSVESAPPVNPHTAAPGSGGLGAHRMRYMGHTHTQLTEDDALPAWIGFEAGPNVLTRGSRTSFGPQLAFTPRLYDGAVAWVPHLEVQFNRTAMYTLSPVLSLGGEALIPFSGFNLYLGPGAGIGRAFGDAEQTDFFPTVSAQFGYRVHDREQRADWRPAERLFVRYTALLSAVVAHQVTAGVGFALR